MRQTLHQFTTRIVSRLENLESANWFLKHARQLVIGLLLLQIAVVAIVAWRIKQRAERELDSTRAGLQRQDIVPFEKRLLPTIAGDGIRLMQSSGNVRSVARFNESYFAASDSGLVELSPDGKFKRRLTVLDGLPESDLTALAVFQSQLFVGTRSQGVLSFDGSRFTAYRWTDRKAQTVTALLEDRGRLLIGTFAGGLLEFDGKRFTERRAGQQRINGIEKLSMDDARLLVGTFSDGLWANDADRWLHFTIADGLPSNRIVGVVTTGEQLILATDFGVATASTVQLFNTADQAPKRFQTIATLPSLASIANCQSTIFLSKDNGELFQLVTDARTNRTQLNPLYWPKPEDLSSCQLNAFSGEQSLWLLSNEGIRRTSWQGERSSGRLNFASFGNLRLANQPTSNLISSLAFDDAGNLWTGSFRNGIDVFTREGRKLTHLESEAIREINSLVWDEDAKQMVAATAQGLVKFNSNMQPQTFSAADGLPSNSILHAATLRTKSSASSPFSGNRADIVLATSRGLSFGNNKQWQALTAVQGLPSNSVYAVQPHREFIYAGTLNGLAQINSGRVVRVFNDSNSKLAQNWVTAIHCVTHQGVSRLFVGTYGGGVFELTASGEFVSFASEIGKQVVNPNAMASDGERLYVGTLDGAWVLELRSQKWLRLKPELPSATVLSVACDGESIYFGTTSGISRVDKKHFELARE